MDNKSELSKPVAWKLHYYGRGHYFEESAHVVALAESMRKAKGDALYSQEYVSALIDVAIALREWIDAVPDEVAASLPTMPGVDRDWVDSVISKENRNG